MKKKIALLLLTVMTMSLIGCGEKDTTDSNDDAGNNDTVAEDNVSDDNQADMDITATGAETAESAVGILQSVWANYEEDSKFAAGGGDSHNMVMDEPGEFDVTNVEELDATLGFPTGYADKIDGAASLMHMMNANTFTSGAYHVTNTEDVIAVCDSLKENIMNRQWMCGFPETLIIVTVDDNYVVSAFGNGQIIEYFKNKLTGTFANVTVVYEESL